MARDDEDRPLQAKTPPTDLAPLSIAELEAYILGLQAEIARAQVAIEDKSRHRTGADALFKR
jgi:uncharacterized small protein (DUF1192 family)